MLEVKVDPKAVVATLGAGQKQLTEIAKAISQTSKVLILDEPSTALAVSDVERLFTFLRKLKAQGVAIIYVSHRMDEIARIADRATILRDGKHVITAPLADLPIDVMIEHIVGKRSKGLADVHRGDASAGRGSAGGEEPDRPAQARQCQLHAPPGRGSGTGRAARLWPLGAGPGDRRASNRPCRARSASRVKPSRSANPPTPSPPVWPWCPKRGRPKASSRPIRSPSNMVLAVLDRISGKGVVDRAKAQAITDDMIKRLSIKTASRDHAVSTLSGGNQQKVVIGKWLATDPDILVLDEPTAGIDIGSKSEIIRLVRDLAAQGKGIVMISSELSELLTACDRILVMADGRAHQMIDRATLDDPTEPDPGHRLQAAERQLQIEIQKALAVKEIQHG